MEEPNTRAPQQSKDFPDSFHRVVVKGLYVKENTILMCHDFFLIGRPPMWELPGGGLDFGESISDALTREVKEEMGLTVTTVAKTPSYIWTSKRENTRGLDWFYSLILAYVFDVETFEAFTPTDECREYKFFSKDELKNLPHLALQLKPFAKLFDPGDFV